MKRISIIVPVYNEGDNIRNAIAKIKAKVKFRHEILIVYDFPEDDTVPVVQELVKKHSEIKLVLNKKKGLINAVRSGFKACAGDAVVILSPDEADDPFTINKMYKKLQEGYDVICASRYSSQGKRINQTSFKLFLSKTAGILTPLFLGIPTQDLTNGYKMYRKKVLDDIVINSDGGWEFSMELTIKAHNAGFKITEVGTISRNRKHGKSKFKLIRWLPRYLYWYVYGIASNLSRIAR